MKTPHIRPLSNLLIAAALSLVTAAATAQSLPRSKPEMEGVSSAGIRGFLDAFAGTPHEMHSMMLVRHGHVVAEGWWSPYAPELTHMMYSTSKSFAATAVGIAAGEGRLSVEDAVTSFFPDKVPNPVPPYLAELKVKHLLSMTVGQDPDPTRAIARTEDWVKSFLETPIVKAPGSRFLYNSAATYMLSAIVTKVTGETVLGYLTPRLFAPLGVSGIDWETDPAGTNTGGWGLRLHTEDMAKFGQLFLQDGVWHGRRLLPEGWVAEASSFKIQQEPEKPAAERAQSDWLQGYCYQMWRCRHNAYRGDGAFGQYIVVMAEQDAVLAITSMTSNMQGILDLVWEHLLPAMRDEALPPDPAGVSALRKQLDGLALPVPEGARNKKLESALSGKSFSLGANDRGIQSIGFEFTRGECKVSLADDEGEYVIPLGAGKWRISETTRRGPYLVTVARNAQSGLPPFEVAGAHRWLDDGALEVTLRYVQGPHTETLVCRPAGDGIDVDISTTIGPVQTAHGTLIP